MERAEESDRHDEGVARDAVHASRGRIAGHDPGGARPDEARHQHHEREPHADVHRPVEPRATRHEPEPPPGVLVREEGPDERDEEGERHQRVEPTERSLADARDDPLPHGKAREDEMRPGEAEPEKHDLRRRRHGRVLARGEGLRQEGGGGLESLSARMPATRALPWLLAGVIVAGCTRSGAVLTAAHAPDALVDLRALDPAIRVEMPYATPHNFTRVALYPVARCLLRRDVAERLVRVERRLAGDGLGLLVWDCYRPFRVQQRLWAPVPDAL